MRQILTLLFVLIVKISFSQGEANIWYFGDEAGLDFNSCAPVALTDGKMVVQEGCSSIADSSGNLLFYTEGTTIWNKNHQIMANGTGLLGDPSTTQSSIIIPKPNSTSTYYVFTVDQVASSNGCKYSTVYMGANGGLGTVSSKNTDLVTPTAESISAVKHSNGSDIWVVTHGFNNNSFYAFLVTDAGVNETPVISNISGSINGTPGDTVGSLKLSPNGKKLAFANRALGTYLFDFDNTNGIISNPINISTNKQCYGVEFSSNSNVLYLSILSNVVNEIYQYNLNATTISSSEFAVSFIDSSVLGIFHGQLQLAPDKKIYVTRAARNTLGVINSPNEIGNLCDFQDDVVSLSYKTSGVGFPAFIQSYFNKTITFENTCLGDITTFNLENVFNTIVWNFDDPTSGTNNTSNEIEPTHLFTAAGIYNVTATLNCGTNTTTETIEVEIVDIPILNPIVELKQCDDDLNGYSSFNLEEANSIISTNYNNETFSFYKTSLDATNATNAITNATAYTNQTPSLDTLWARVENGNECFDTCQINLIVTTTQIPSSFQRDFYECDNDADGVTTFNFSSVENEIIALFPTGQKLIISYYKNIEDALAELNVITDTSFYKNTDYPNYQDIYVRVDNELDNSCLGLGAHISLTVLEQPQFELDEMATICNNSAGITVNTYNPSATFNYEWFNETGTIVSTSPSALITNAGTYTVYANASYTNGNCESTPHQITITASEQATITLSMITISDNTVTINTNLLGAGNYEFSLDDEFGIYQTTSSFNNVLAGIHTLYINDLNGCGISTLEIPIIGFPHFFTPNNDSYNDTWNVIGINSELYKSVNVYIYDRFGKLLANFDALKTSWNGFYNGKALTSSDYWFFAKITDNNGNISTQKGHFSLIRE